MLIFTVELNWLLLDFPFLLALRKMNWEKICMHWITEEIIVFSDVDMKIHTHQQEYFFPLVCLWIGLQFLNYSFPIQIMSVNEYKLNIEKIWKTSLTHYLYKILQSVYISTATHHIHSLG